MNPYQKKTGVLWRLWHTRQC